MFVVGNTYWPAGEPGEGHRPCGRNEFTDQEGTPFFVAYTYEQIEEQIAACGVFCPYMPLACSGPGEHTYYLRPVT